jgi:hypothetical protein
MKNIAEFLYKNIITQFNCPMHLVIDQHFINTSIELLVQDVNTSQIDHLLSLRKQSCRINQENIEAKIDQVNKC